MAAPKENLLSLGHKNSTDRNTFTKQRAHSSKNSVHRPLLTQIDFSAQQSPQHLRVMHLQQRWQELKERELTAQQHNRQLLQQFEKAQDALREMLACNAAMKTIRMEYERYLEESTPRWQQQLKEKTQAAQRKRMEEYVRSCLNDTEQEQITKSSTDQPSLAQGLAKKPQKVSAPQENNQNSHYSQGVYPHLPYVQSSWLTHPPSQTPRFPIRMPSQPQGSSHVPPSYLPPPSIFPYPHQFQLQQLASSSSHHYPWPGHDPPGWASPQPNYSWPWPTGAAGIPSGSGALWGQLYMEKPPHHERGPEGASADAETSRIYTSRRERGGGSRSSHVSQELDIKPVRLSNGHTESSESGRDSSQASREKTKKEKRGKTQRTSSDRDRSSSHESSVTSSAIVIAGVAVAQGSESDTSSEQCSTSGSRRTRTRSGGFAAGLPRMEEVANERTRRKGGDSGSHNEETESTGEESVNHINGSRDESVRKGSPDDKSDSCGEEESKSVSAEAENGNADIENQEKSINAEEKKDEEELEDIREGDNDHDDEEKENSQRNEEQEERNVEEDDEVSARKNTANEEEGEDETGAEEELEDDGDDALKDEDGENRTQGSASASSEDEEESEEDDDKMGEDKEESAEEEEGEGEEEEEQRSSEVEEERDSEDSIISPQETRLKRIHTIPEEAAEDEDEEQRGSKTGSSDEDSIGFSEEDDIEELLAPQEQTKKKEEKELKVDDKPEATCDKVEVFQVELDNSTRTDHQSDSDEFDHFYD